MSKLSDLMRVDPLGEAEKITGESYKKDDLTSALGLLLHLDHTQKVKDAAKAERDTYYSIDFAGALGVYEDLGFDVVLRDEFKHEGREEKFYVLWHEHGILGTLESYRGDGMNSAKIYYNVESAEALPWDVRSSGRYQSAADGDYVWVGDHDARTGLRASFSGLAAHGKFLPAWVERPHLWLITYGDGRSVESMDWPTKSKAYDTIREDRIARLPEHVRRAITP